MVAVSQILGEGVGVALGLARQFALAKNDLERVAICDEIARNLLPNLIKGEPQTISYSDEKGRSTFVYFQQLMESAISGLLKSNKLSAALGVIHTPLPATPLRTNGQLTSGLVAEEVANDPKRLETILHRPNIVRDFMSAGGVLLNLFSDAEYQAARARFAGKQAGVTCSDEQVATLEAAKAQFGDRLQLRPLKAEKPKQQELIDQLKDSLSGATYILEDKEGQRSLFSIRSYQAHSPAVESKPWGLWLGALEKVQDRLSDIKGLAKEFEVSLEKALETSRQAIIEKQVLRSKL